MGRLRFLQCCADQKLHRADAKLIMRLKVYHQLHEQGDDDGGNHECQRQQEQFDYAASNALAHKHPYDNR